MVINSNSGQVEIIGLYGRVYLYTHSNAKDLINIIQEILTKKVRWDDPDYLTRMIFCKMIPQNEWDNETGYGIGTQLYKDVNILISLDTFHQTIKLSSFENGHFINGKTASFAYFIKNFANDADL